MPVVNFEGHNSDRVSFNQNSVTNEIWCWNVSEDDKRKLFLLFRCLCSYPIPSKNISFLAGYITMTRMM